MRMGKKTCSKRQFAMRMPFPEPQTRTQPGCRSERTPQGLVLKSHGAEVKSHIDGVKRKVRPEMSRYSTFSPFTRLGRFPASTRATFGLASPGRRRYSRPPVPFFSNQNSPSGVVEVMRFVLEVVAHVAHDHAPGAAARPAGEAQAVLLQVHDF